MNITVSVVMREPQTGQPERGEQAELPDNPLLFVSAVVPRWNIDSGLWPADWVTPWRVALTVQP